jgi:hypothetical protein
MPRRPIRILVSASLAFVPFACAGTITPQLAPLNQYCSGCHKVKTKAGGLAFDSATASPSHDSQVWEKIARRLRNSPYSATWS